MMISDEHRFVFVHVYKTGGSSLTRLLSGLVEKTHRGARPRNSGLGWQETWHLAGGQHWKMSDLRDLDEWKQRDLSDYLLISFVRDPYTWVLSVWNNFYREATNPGAVQFATLFPDRSFPSFCRFLSTCTGDASRDVWGASTQSSFTQDVGGKGAGEHFIGRFERFDTDVRALERRLGLDVREVPHEVRNEDIDRSDHFKYYTSESMEIVNRVFEEDFERFSYERIREIPKRMPAVDRWRDEHGPDRASEEGKTTS